MNNEIRSYRDLEVWQKAIELVKDIYNVTRTFPDEEKFGLTVQIRRASISIASNIAEGHARMSTAEFMRFITIAMGSTAEVETQIILSYELGYISKDTKKKLMSHTDSIGKMLRKLHQSLKRRLNN